jgi:ubiquinone/menaquinone biosynthesis C-methylase UbiE
MADLQDVWAAGSTYEGFMGRWSRQLAPLFASWLQVPAGAHWLDVGCGTGAMTDAISREAEPTSVLGCDPAESFIEFARRHTPHRHASFAVAGSGGLPRRAGGYGCVTSLFALNFLPDPVAGLREMRDLAAPGGVVSACVWDYAGGMEFLRRFWDEAVAMDAAAQAYDEGTRFPLCRPEALTNAFRAAGLTDVRCEPIDITTVFADFEDYWQPFLGGVGPAPSYVASLRPDRRALLKARLRQVLPRGPDGTIHLGARAWAISGTAN